MNDRNRGVIEAFHANNGKVPGFPTEDNIALLTTTGAKSGEPRVTPLVFHRDGDRVIVVASKGGAPEHPAWYHNLRANPKVTVEVGTEKYEATATIAEGEERDRLYAQQVDVMPGFADYEKKTTRKIPVVILTKA